MANFVNETSTGDSKGTPSANGTNPPDVVTTPQSCLFPDRNTCLAEHISHSDSNLTRNELEREVEVFRPLATAVPSLRDLTASAQAATRAEQRTSFWEGCRLYPKAIAWSILLSSTIIMDGYDMSLLTSFFTFPIFRQSYGEPVQINSVRGRSQSFEISPAWQAGLINGTQVGVIIGLLSNGWIADRFGYHRTVIVALVLLSFFVFLAFFARNIETLLAAQILCGIPWGIFQTLSVSYAAEVMPVSLRGHLLSYINFCWVLGQTCGVVVIRAFVSTESQWAYRVPFALQWAFVSVIMISILFAPESPWWLIRHGKFEEARKCLLKLITTGRGSLNADEIVAMMVHTNEVEKYLGKGKISYLSCFKGVDLRRTEITTMAWITQQVCGSTLTFYAAYFYEQAGFQVKNAFNLAVGMYGMAILANIVCWFLLPWVGRRRLYLFGVLSSLIVLITAGSVGTLPQTTAQSWALGSLIILLTFIYQMTLGPVCYMIVGEIPSTRLRVKTVVIGRIAYNLTSIINNTIAPRMLNPVAWNWKGKSCFFYVGTTVLCFVWCYSRLPETFGLSYLEIDILFERRAEARKFRKFQENLARLGYYNLPNSERGGSVWQRY